MFIHGSRDQFLRTTNSTNKVREAAKIPLNKFPYELAHKIRVKMVPLFLVAFDLRFSLGTLLSIIRNVKQKTIKNLSFRGSCNSLAVALDEDLFRGA